MSCACGRYACNLIFSVEEGFAFVGIHHEIFAICAPLDCEADPFSIGSYVYNADT